MPARALYIGKVRPQLYIGLGGAGGAMVRRVYDHFHQNDWWLTVRKHSTQFMVLDTNLRDIDRVQTAPEIATVLLRDDPTVGAGDPFLAEMRGGLRPRSSIAGAGQIRLESRQKLHMSEQAVRKALRDGLGRALAEGNGYLDAASKELDVLVFASLGGGTGSGAFLPLAYLVRDVVAGLGWKATLVGNFVHASGVIDRVGDLADFVQANSFAAVKELEYLTASAYLRRETPFAWRRSKGSADEVPLVTCAPYDLLFLADRPERELDPGDVIDLALADAAYVQLITPAGDRAAGARDNYSRFQQELVKECRSATKNRLDAAQETRGYTSHWGTHGATALTFPARDFMRYCAERWCAATFEVYLGDRVATQKKRDPRHFTALELQLRAQQDWVEGVEKTAEREWRAAVAARRDAGFDVRPDRRPGLAGIVLRVSGLDFSEEAAPVAATSHDPFAAPHDGVLAHVRGSLGQKVLDELVRRRAESMTATLPAAPSIAEHELGQAWNRLQELDDAYEKLRQANDDRRKRARSWARDGACLNDLRQLEGPEEPIDGRTVRYLLALFRVGCARWQLDGEPWRGLDKEIEVREARIRTLYPGTFATSKEEMSQATQQRFTDADQAAKQEASAGWMTKSLRSLLGRPGFDASAASSELVAILRHWQGDTNELERWKTEVEILTGLREFVDRRLKNLEALAAEANRHAIALRDQALDRMAGRLRDAASFTIGGEVLQPMGGKPTDRQWGYLYEDWVSAQVSDACRDDDVAKIFDEAIDGAEGQDGVFVARRVVGQLHQKLAAIVEAVLQPLIFGSSPAGPVVAQAPGAAASAPEAPGLGLDRLLRWEALYVQIPDDVRSRGADWTTQGGEAQRVADALLRDRRRRVEALAELDAALADPHAPKHAEVSASTSRYIAGRLKALAGQSMTLACVTETEGPTPSLNQVILVADARVEAQLRAYLPADLGGWVGVLGVAGGQAQVESGEGLWIWNDPHTLFVYRVRGVLTIDRFTGINEAYDAYASFGPGQRRHRPHPFHIDVAWEDTLPEIAPRALQEQAQERQRMIELLARALVCGVVLRPNARAHWRVCVAGRETMLGASDVELIVAFITAVTGWNTHRRQTFEDAVAAARPNKASAEASLRRLEAALSGAPTGLPELAQLIASMGPKPSR